MSEASATTSQSLPAPLKSHQRWLFGGIGALAPMVVAAITLDMVTVFRDTDIPVVLGWTVKCVLLAYLHQSETDTWRCFVIGISAPALITTAMAGSASNASLRKTTNVIISNVIISTAYADQKLIRDVNERIPKVTVLRFSDLQEGGLEKFLRGLTSQNPIAALAVISGERNEQSARMVAAAVMVLKDCGLLEGQRGGGFLAPDQAFVLQDRSANSYLVMMQLADPQYRFASKRIDLQPQDIIVTRRSSIHFELGEILRTRSFYSIAEKLMSQLSQPEIRCG